MTSAPFVKSSPLFDDFLDKLTGEEHDRLILDEKVKFMSNVAVDRLYSRASGHIMSLKGPALMALAAHGDERCAGLIVDFINDQNHTLKTCAIESIEVLGDPSLSLSLVTLLHDPSAMIRIRALEVLSTLNVKLFYSVLNDISKDDVWFVREKLAQVLGEHSDGRDTLEVLSRDQNFSVRSTAQDALYATHR
jgi:HEAT repeat protein